MIITIVGGGSTFTPGIVKSIALRQKELEVEEVRLFDIDEERQYKVSLVVDWILKDMKSPIRLTVTTDKKTAYENSSFIFAQMRVGKYAMRERMRRSRCVTAVWDRRPVAAADWPTACARCFP